MRPVILVPGQFELCFNAAEFMPIFLANKPLPPLAVPAVNGFGMRNSKSSKWASSCCRARQMELRDSAVPSNLDLPRG
jgi:hypothetical protein